MKYLIEIIIVAIVVLSVVMISKVVCSMIKKKKIHALDMDYLCDDLETSVNYDTHKHDVRNSAEHSGERTETKVYVKNDANSDVLDGSFEHVNPSPKADNPVKDKVDDIIKQVLPETSKERWMLSIYERKSHRLIKRMPIQKAITIGRQKDNDIQLKSGYQHRYELAIGYDGKGVFVNSLDHADGKYAYGEGSYNVLPKNQTIIPSKEKSLKIIYVNMLYVIEYVTRRPENKKDSVVRYDEIIEE